jgi:chorismate-pyruvate lyase
VGITIFYQGSLDDIAQYPAFESRVKDWIVELGGEFQLLSDLRAKSKTNRGSKALSPDAPSRSALRGIIANMHPKHEPLSLLVSPTGAFVSVVSMILESRGEPIAKSDEPEICFLKTQQGTIDSHIAVVELLSRIKDEFCSNLHVTDESGYWEHRDRHVLAEKLGLIQSIIDHFTQGFRKYPLNAEAAEDPDIVVERLKRIAGKIQEEVTEDGNPIEIEVITFEETEVEDVHIDFDDVQVEFLNPPEPTEEERQQETLFRHTLADQKEIRKRIQSKLEQGISFDEALKQTLIERGLPPPVYVTPSDVNERNEEYETEMNYNTQNDGDTPPIVDLAQLIQLVDPDMEQLGTFKRCNSKELPQPYKQLLSHNEHMTVTVEAFHSCRITVEVLQSWTDGNFYIREILLRRESNQEIILYGVVRLRLDSLDEAPRAAILSESIPLGRVLIEHNVLRNVELVELWKIAMGPRLATHFSCPEGTTTFGRTAMIYFHDQPALELIEIVRPELPV